MCYGARLSDWAGAMRVRYYGRNIFKVGEVTLYPGFNDVPTAKWFSFITDDRVIARQSMGLIDVVDEDTDGPDTVPDTAGDRP